MYKGKYLKEFENNYLDNSNNEFFGYTHDGFTVQITKEKRRPKLFYIMVNHPTGGYIYDGYFEGTITQAMNDVFDEIESCRPYVEEEDEED